MIRIISIKKTIIGKRMVKGSGVNLSRNFAKSKLFFFAVCSRTQTVCQQRWAVSCCSCQTEQQHRAQRISVRGSRRSRDKEEKAVIPSTIPTGTLQTLPGTERILVCKMFCKSKEYCSYVGVTVLSSQIRAGTGADSSPFCIRTGK